MGFLILIFVVIFFIVSPTFRCAIFHPINFIKYLFADVFLYFKRKKRNECAYGKIIGYIADDNQAFGCGKTLTAVEFIDQMYKKYNDKMIWCPERKKFVKQKIVVLSNVAFKQIPYIKFTSLKQFVSFIKERYVKDREEDVLTVTIGLIDEASSILNSRSFKNNFSATVIASLLTARHMRASLYYTSQRATLVDALLRNVTHHYISCNKFWRFERLNYYDSFEIENATNPSLVQPYARKCWFITNKSFNKYNTYELLQDIDKKCEEGDMMTEAEILESLCMPEANVEGVMKPSKKYIRKRKKMNK